VSVSGPNRFCGEATLEADDARASWSDPPHAAAEYAIAVYRRRERSLHQGTHGIPFFRPATPAECDRAGLVCACAAAAANTIDSAERASIGRAPACEFFAPQGSIGFARAVWAPTIRRFTIERRRFVMGSIHTGLVIGEGEARRTLRRADGIEPREASVEASAV